MAGAPAPDIEASDGASAMTNDAALARRVAPSIAAAFGDKVKFVPASAPGAPASEDFGAFAEAGMPLVYYWIGGTEPKALAEMKAKGIAAPINHSPFFAPSPEPTIRAGVMALAISVLTVTTPASDTAPATRR